MTEYRYPASSLAVSLTRGLAGVVAFLSPFFVVDPAPMVQAVLIALAALFAVYAVRAVLRHLCVVRMDDDGIGTVGPMGRHVAWDSLAKVRLSYYTTGRDRRRGWMELKISTARRTLRIESSIGGFAEIVERTVGEAQRRGLPLDPATSNNLEPLGIRADSRARTGAI